MVIKLQPTVKELRRSFLGIHCQLRYLLLAQSLFVQEMNMNITLQCFEFHSAWYDRASDLIACLNQLGGYLKQSVDILKDISFREYDSNSNRNYLAQFVSLPARPLKYALNVLEKEGVICWPEIKAGSTPTVLELKNEQTFYICQRALHCQLIDAVSVLVNLLKDIKQNIISIFDWYSEVMKQSLDVLVVFFISPSLSKDLYGFYQ